MKKSSLYTNVRANQLKMAIFLIGFLLIALPGETNAKLISVGTVTDSVSLGGTVGIGTTSPEQPLHIVSSGSPDTNFLYDVYYDGTTTNPSFITRRARGSLLTPASVLSGDSLATLGGGGYGATQFTPYSKGSLKIFAAENWTDTAQGTYISLSTTANGGTSVSERIRIADSGNIGIGLTNPTAKLYVSGTLLNTLATTHSLLGGVGNAIVMTDNSGSLFSATPDVFVGAINVSTLYHIKKWFTPQSGQTISSSGTTVTMANPVASYQFSSSMVGSRLTINSESRVITAYTSTSVVTVDSAFSTNYSGFDYTLWGVYSRAVNIASDGSISTYSETGGVAIQKRSGDTNTYIPALLDSNNNYYLPSSILYLDKDFPIKWSGATSYSSSVNDVGLRRTATGTLEIYDGTGTTPGTVADYRDLNIRSLNPAGGNVGIGTTNPNSKLEVTGALRVTRSTIGSEYIDISAEGGTKSITSQWSLNINTGSNQNLTFNPGSGNSIFSSGNVGIGTTAPNAKLYVSGQNVSFISGTSANTMLMGRNYIEHLSVYNDDTGVTLESVQDEDAAGYGNMIFKVDNDGTANGYFAFQNKSGTNFLRINSAGNVGIGITDPGAYRLNVAGGTVLFGGTAARLSVGNQATDGDVHFGASGMGAPANGLQDYGFYAAYNAYRASDGNWYHSRTASVGAARFTGGNAGATGLQGFHWSTAASQGAAAITWTELMTLTPSGNLGIGTTSPTNLLSIEKAQDSSTDIQITNTSTGSSAKSQMVTWDGTTSATFGMRSSGFTSWGALDASDAYVWAGDDISLITSTAGKSIKFGTGNGTPTERMRITDDGNVGIGTTTPNTKLYVNGSALVTGVSYVNLGIELGTASSHYISYYGALASNYFTRMMTTGTGGYGTYGPVTSDWALYNRFNGADTRGWIWQLGTVNVAALNGQGHMQIAGNFNSQGSGNNYFAGNVGIGITSPAAKLDVAGTTKLGTAGGAFTAMGTCTIASTAISNLKMTYTCTGVPASTAVAVNCSGSTTQSGTGTLYCRATGTANEVACNTSDPNITMMTWTCMWIQP